MTFPFHPSLSELPQECREWLEHMQKTGDLDRHTVKAQAYLDTPGQLNAKAVISLGRVAHHLGIAACDCFFRGDAGELARFLQWATATRALVFRWEGMYSQMHPDLGNWPTEFWDSMKAAGPSMLSWWAEASVCAEHFLQMAEKDQRVNVLADSRRISRNTNDAFLAFLFSQAFQLPTSFQPLKPLVPEYQDLLGHWRTTDQTAFQAAMASAAEFHISRSRDGTDKTKYEFEKDIDRVFPAELLAIQALRRREGLPEFRTGHLLIDTPWDFIRDLPQVEPYPLAAAVEARLKQDYPLFK